MPSACVPMVVLAFSLKGRNNLPFELMQNYIVVLAFSLKGRNNRVMKPVIACAVVLAFSLKGRNNQKDYRAWCYGCISL